MLGFGELKTRLPTTFLTQELIFILLLLFFLSFFFFYLGRRIGYPCFNTCKFPYGDLLIIPQEFLNSIKYANVCPNWVTRIKVLAI